jgi:capsid protein
MTSAQLSKPRLPAGSLVITPEMSFRLGKAGFDVARFGAFHASQDTRFRDFSTGGSPGNSRTEADYFPRADRGKVIARGRVMFRNNPYFAACALAYVQEMGTPTLKSQTSDENYNDAKERRFERWAADCEVEEDLSLAEVIDIFHFEEIVAGELFVVKRLEGWLQLIASELCGTASNNRGKQLVNLPGVKPQAFADGTPVPEGATERDGVIRSAAGFIIGYRFGTRDDQGAISFAPERSTLVQNQYVFHLCSRQRTEQSRGVPLAIAVLNSLQDLGETAGARAQQVKNASCLSLWITKNVDPAGFATSMQGALARGDVDTAAALKESVATRSGHQEVRAGTVMYGEAGETLQVIEPRLNAADFHEHYIDLAQIICASLNGMPVEIAFEGFRASSYSSARATMNKWKRNVIRSRKRLEQKFLQPLQLWQSARAHIFNEIPAAPEPEGSVSYNTDENVRFGWPAIPDIDGAKTAATNALELANGTTSLETVYADKGEYAADETLIIAKERARFLKQFIEQGKAAGLDETQARAWALAQMPAPNASLLQPMIAAAVIDSAPPPPAR